MSIVAHRSFHYEYEILPVKFLIISDLPAMLMVGITVDPVLNMTERSPEVASDIEGLAWVGFGSLQWWLIGTYVSLKRRRHHESDR